MSHLPNSSLNMTDYDASSAGFTQITSQLSTSYASSSLNHELSTSDLQPDRTNFPAQKFRQLQPYSIHNALASTSQPTNQVPNFAASSCINYQQPDLLIHRPGRFFYSG